MQSGVSFGRAPCAAIIAGAAIGLAAVTVSGMQADGRERATYDKATGRNLLNYPPHRAVDVKHMRLAVRITDMNQREMECEETLTFTPITSTCSEFALHGAQLDIQSATIAGRSVTVAANPEQEMVTFRIDPPLQRGQVVDMTVRYRVSNPPEGLLWTVESSDRPGLSAQIHSQGQSECNRYWFLSHDFPNARMTSEIIATVPHGYQVISNGRQVSHTSGAEEVFHWRLDRAHPSYLVSMVVGKFDRVDVGSSSLPMPVYVAPGEGSRVKATFGRTPKMIELFARITDEPYPWPQYAQVSVRNFEWGGMENTSATTLLETVALDTTAFLDDDQDDLISHELAHQWFGDLLTCKSWEHIWLNEGFATYLEKVWAQYRESSVPSRGRGVEGLRADDDAYQSLMWNDMTAVIKADHAAAPYQAAMASKQYAHPDDVFDREANPYPKGSVVLHMLRERLGDEVFWRAVAAYVDAYKDQPVETFQFREVFERVSGTSLQRFMDQWVLRPGVPRITATPTWDEATKTLTVAFEQTQNIDGYNPAFALSIPIWIKVSGETTPRVTTADFDTRTGTVNTALPREPEMVVIDPRMAVLMDLSVKQDVSRTVSQARQGPTLAARLQAARMLGFAQGTDQAAAIEGLRTALQDDRAHRSLRIEAARSLGRIANPEAAESSEGERVRGVVVSQDALGWLVALSLAPTSDPRIDRVLIEEAAKAAGATVPDDKLLDSFRNALARRFNSDKSYAVRAAAVKGLGTMRSVRHIDVISAALSVDSQHDQIRCAAAEALGLLDDPAGLALVIDATNSAHSSSLRPAATKAIGELAHHDPAHAIERLTTLLNDPEPKTRTAAGEALAQINDPRALAALEAHARTARGRTATHQAQEWLKKDEPSAAAQ